MFIKVRRGSFLRSVEETGRERERERSTRQLCSLIGSSMTFSRGSLIFQFCVQLTPCTGHTHHTIISGCMNTGGLYLWNMKVLDRF